MGVTRIRYLLRQWRQSSAILSNYQKDLKPEKDPEPARSQGEDPARKPPPEKK